MARKRRQTADHFSVDEELYEPHDDKDDDFEDDEDDDDDEEDDDDFEDEDEDEDFEDDDEEDDFEDDDEEDDDEEDDDDFDEDDDEDEDDEDEDEDDERSPLPTFPVANTDATLLTFLTAITSGDATAAPALVEWLSDRAAPRAAPVRELAGARCVLPEGSCPGVDFIPMACGTLWCIVRRSGGVTAYAYRGTPLYRLLRAVRPAGDVVRRIPQHGQTPERLRAGFERCRQALILALFGTSAQTLRARQVVLAEADLQRVDETVARHGHGVIPWLLEMHRSDPGRFGIILKRILACGGLREIGYALLDALDPGWQQRLPGVPPGRDGPGHPPQPQ